MILSPEWQKRSDKNQRVRRQQNHDFPGKELGKMMIGEKNSQWINHLNWIPDRQSYCFFNPHQVTYLSLSLALKCS